MKSIHLWVFSKILGRKTWKWAGWIRKKYSDFLLVKYFDHVRCTSCPKMIEATDRYCQWCGKANLLKGD